MSAKGMAVMIRDDMKKFLDEFFAWTDRDENRYITHEDCEMDVPVEDFTVGTLFMKALAHECPKEEK